MNYRYSKGKIYNEKHTKIQGDSMKVAKFTLTKIFIFWLTLCILFLLLFVGCGKKEVDKSDSDGLSVNSNKTNRNSLLVNIEENYNAYKTKMQVVLSHNEV